MPDTRRDTRVLPADAAGVAKAAAVLRAGGLVAMPTETVYGLAADATDARAVAATYAAKGRPAFNPLIAHVASLAAAQAEGAFDATALALARAFWPGPLTLVVPLGPRATVCELARAGLASVALRVPAHSVARALIEAAGRPIAAPSGNRSGSVSPTRVTHVLADLDGRIDLALDAGPCAVGVESSIVACLGGSPQLLRPGGVTREAMEGVIGAPLAGLSPSRDAPIAPGLLASHYAPRAALRLAATTLAPGEAALDFGGRLAGLACGAYVDLSPTRDLIEAAAALFAHLRALDATGAKTIAVAPIPANGLGEAINDRLARAAAPRR